MDKIYIAQSWLGELSTAPWGVISDKFVLDEKEWYNKLQPGANEGANVCRVLPFSLFGNASPEAVFQPFKYVGNGQWDLRLQNRLGLKSGWSCSTIVGCGISRGNRFCI
jgi:hypothetical protein